MIITKYDPKPIPERHFEWSAVTENYEGGDPIGYGPIEEEAIEDLLEKLEAEQERRDLVHEKHLEDTRDAVGRTFR